MVVYALQNLFIARLCTTGSGITSDQIITGGWDINDTQTALYLRDNGGETRGYPDNKSQAIIQIASRSRTDYDARLLIDKAFTAVREEFNITLSFDSYNFKAKHILAIQRPSSMGISKNGLFEYVYNYRIIFSE